MLSTDCVEHVAGQIVRFIVAVMGKLAIGVVAVFMGVAALAGALQALVGGLADRPVAVALSSSGCVGVAATVRVASDGAVMDIRAQACRTGPEARLATEDAAFAGLAIAAWRTSGPQLAFLAITLGRSADHPDEGLPPRTLVLTGAEAAARWGPRPAAAGADTLQQVRAALNTGLWLSGSCGSVLLATMLMAALACGIRRGVGVIWFVR